LYNKNTEFGVGDHRNYNREGNAFDKGETFSGIDFDKGLQAVEELKKIFPDMPNLAPIALQWILNFQEVGVVIPGASKIKHVNSNLSIYDLPELSEDKIKIMNTIYEKYIKASVHQLW